MHAQKLFNLFLGATNDDSVAKDAPIVINQRYSFFRLRREKASWTSFVAVCLALLVSMLLMTDVLIPSLAATPHCRSTARLLLAARKGLAVCFVAVGNIKACYASLAT